MTPDDGAGGPTRSYKEAWPPANSYNGTAMSLAARPHRVDLRKSDRARLAGDRSQARAVIDPVVQNPVLTTSRIARALNASLQSELNLVRRLEAEGTVTEARGVPGRSKRWVSIEVLAAIDPTETPTITTEDDQ